MIASSQIAAIRERAWEANPALYFQDCLKIRDKQNRVISLDLNRGQHRVQDAIEQQRKAGKPVRILILKYRQGGFSTQTQANIFHNCRFKGGAYMTVSLDQDSAEHIFGIGHRFYEYLPDEEKRVLRTEASSRKELKFAEPHGGRIIVETAGKTSAGHSFTLTGLHLSEVSRWPEGTEDARAGLLNSVPDTPESIIIVESVANGMQGWFYQEWCKPDSAYAKVFIPWYEQPEYKLELPCSVSQYEETITDEERQQITRYSLTLEQIEWRRHTILNKLDGNREKFREQYPATAEEAFLASGNTFFHIQTLEAMAIADPFRCDLRVHENPSGERELRVVSNPRGLLRLWHRPKDSSEYVIGADVAEGIEIEGAPADDIRDYSCADVVDRATGEHVAQLHGHITPDEFGRQLALLGEYYNHAFIGVESNAGYGLHAIDELKRQKYPEHLIYRKQVTDETTRRTTEKLGWQTTVRNKKSMCSELDQSLRNTILSTYSVDTLRELKGFVTKPTGQIEGGNGCKDDRVISLAIANQMLKAAPAMALVYDEQQKLESRAYQPTRSVYAYKQRQAERSRFGTKFVRLGI